jgi:hypothetical protein
LHHQLFQSKAKKKSVQDQKLAWLSSTRDAGSARSACPNPETIDAARRLFNAARSVLADVASRKLERSIH